ncbi:uncharacterized protein LOC105182598 [Harpegnathos saltator]|uniref:uncharacterized protein LOC105182598 n=1 Tax=Harpegnathos saltator TaxID=610380 RepID=UPI000DBEE5AC|nr:uncharacterized protein LOC105182598 [Harpegnathos saltator]
MTELGTGLGLPTKPHYISPINSCWFGGRCGSAAVVARPVKGPPCELRAEGNSFVAVDWGPIIVVGVYLPHYRNRVGLGKLAHIKGILDRVRDVAHRCYPRPVVIAGDFNAHSKDWGCDPWQEDSQGEALID